MRLLMRSAHTILRLAPLLRFIRSERYDVLFYRYVIFVYYTIYFFGNCFQFALRITLKYKAVIKHRINSNTENINRDFLHLLRFHADTVFHTFKYQHDVSVFFSLQSTLQIKNNF